MRKIVLSASMMILILSAGEIMAQSGYERGARAPDYNISRSAAAGDYSSIPGGVELYPGEAAATERASRQWNAITTRPGLAPGQSGSTGLAASSVD